MKKMALGILGILTVLVMLPVFTMPAVYAADQPSDTAPPGFVPETAPVIEVGCDKLLVEDVIPWSSGGGGIDNPKYEAAIELGYITNVVTSTMFADPGFILLDAMGKPMWRVIMFTSDQPQGYYDNLAIAAPKVAAYVAAGGRLVADVCDMGWHGGWWTGILPGAVGHVFDPEQDLHIVNPLDIFTGMTDAQISGWGYSTHGYFTNLEPGTIVLVVKAGTSLPVYIEYAWGMGLVKANLMTLEWSAQGWSWTERGKVGIGYTIIKNEITEAQRIPEFGLPTFAVTSILFAAMAVFVTRKRRLLIKT